MGDNKLEYRQIMKATSLFGGVQAVNIMISIIRNKFIAILIGPAGMGYAGLLISTTSFISGLTNFGLGVSAIKDISLANATGDQKRVSTVIAVFKRLVWITGILGTLVTLVFSHWISKFTFGNDNYTYALASVSITLLFTQLSSGQLVVLQGMRKLKYLAKASTIGAISGFLITLPLYYFWGIQGIVPAIILTSLSTFLVSWYFRHKIKIAIVKVNRQQISTEGKSMLTMGFVISFNGLFTLAASYFMSIFINRIGGINDVGLYNAGFAIVNSYVGMVFTAMLTDYYPRLSAVVKDVKLCNQTIRQQADIALLILAPIITVFMIFIQIGIILLLSPKFLAVIEMINWAILGVFFKTACWPISIIFLPKGDSKLFFFNEMVANTYTFILNLLGYYYFGLQGLGISYLLVYLIYFIQVSTIAKIKYNFSYERVFYKIFSIQLILVLLCFISSKFLHNQYLLYPIGIVFIGLSSWYSLKELDKRLGIKTLLTQIREKYYYHQ